MVSKNESSYGRATNIDARKMPEVNSAELRGGGLPPSGKARKIKPRNVIVKRGSTRSLR